MRRNRRRLLRSHRGRRSACRSHRKNLEDRQYYGYQHNVVCEGCIWLTAEVKDFVVCESYDGFDRSFGDMAWKVSFDNPVFVIAPI